MEGAAALGGSIISQAAAGMGNVKRLVYLAAICGIIHYWWQVKPGVLSPLRLTIVLAVLLLARPVLAYIQRRKKSPITA